MALARLDLALAAAAALTVALSLPTGNAQDAKPQGAPPAARGGGMQGGDELINALKAAPGCLGVETAVTGSGKQVIFAWFEDKKAVLKWYHSPTHQRVMKDLAPAPEYPKPLKDIADDSGPIMVIASITMADKERFKEIKLPVSQIAIELYRPLPGGAALGGRFAPAGLKVPGLRDYTPKDEKK